MPTIEVPVPERALIRKKESVLFESSFSIKCTNCVHAENISTGLKFSEAPDIVSNANFCPSNCVAIDCEMVGVGTKRISAVGRVSIVNYVGDVLYDMMSRPDEVITDYRTPWSGIRCADMQRAIPFSCVQEQVQRIIKGRIVVGHMIHNDFAVLRLNHPKELIRDTAKAPHAKILAGYPTKRVISLKRMTENLFGVSIQTGEHCSVEDARATMAIYRLVENEWETALLSTDKKIVHSGVKNIKSDTETAVPLSLAGTVRYSTHLSLTQNGSTDQSDIATGLLPNKRRFSLPNQSTLKPSLSCSSLLDDEFWPDKLSDAETNQEDDGSPLCINFH